MNTTNGSQKLIDFHTYTSNNSGGSCDASSIPSGYTKCADEGGHCDFSGTKQVYYGASNCYKVKSFSDGVDCKNDIFGDPVPGTGKACYIENSGPPTPDHSVQFYKDANYINGYCYGDNAGNYMNIDGCSGYNDQISSVLLNLVGLYGFMRMPI